MPPPETGKERWARIPLDYYKHADAVQRWKSRLSWAALVGTAALLVLWLIVLPLLGSSAGQYYYSRGPVAAVHSAWEHNCSACHVAFAPASDRVLLTSYTGQPHASNERCESCHAGPPHHSIQKPELRCGSCHREHRGPDASLVRLPDSDCTRCHANLTAHMSEPSHYTEPFANTITRFDVDHPMKSRSVPPEDPGKLKFNHKLHMAAGMIITDRKEDSWTLAKIPEGHQRERYRRPEQRNEDDATNLVRLECRSCHQLDAGDFEVEHLPGVPDSVLPVNSSGAYMLPITYENQCEACHPLTFERQWPKDPPRVDRKVPHRLQPAEVREFLHRTYAGMALQEESRLLEQVLSFASEKPRLIPGKAGADKEITVKELIQTRTRKAEQILYSKNACGECHQFVSEDGQAAPKHIVPPQIPQVWFKHATFNHAAHRAVDCKECHARAYPDSRDRDGKANASESSSDVLIPGIDTCRQCHRPPGHANGKPVGGARFDCTECHRYHNRDNQAALLQGVGAAGRVGRRGTIGTFLSGKLGREEP